MNDKPELELPVEIPVEIKIKANDIDLYFKTLGIKNWQLMGICDRNIAYKNHELRAKIEVHERMMEKLRHLRIGIIENQVSHGRLKFTFMDIVQQAESELEKLK